MHVRLQGRQLICLKKAMERALYAKDTGYSILFALGPGYGFAGLRKHKVLLTLYHYVIFEELCSSFLPINPVQFSVTSKKSQTLKESRCVNIIFKDLIFSYEKYVQNYETKLSKKPHKWPYPQTSWQFQR